MKISNPIKRHGGKSYLAKRIYQLMPAHTRYCEPYFGGGSVLFAHDGNGRAEFVNDIDWDLTNFWQVLKSPDHSAEFIRRVNCTPFSQSEFESACIKDNPITAAVAFFVINRQSRQALGEDFATPTSRLRRGICEQVSAWLSAVDGLPAFHARLRQVEIRNQLALDFIRELDSPDTFFYLDPPYPHDVRSVKDAYKHEMSYEDHFLLLERLRSINGKFILSGYHCDLYDAMAAASNWHCVEIEIDNKASSAKTKEKKIECLWMNYDNYAFYSVA